MIRGCRLPGVAGDAQTVRVRSAAIALVAVSVCGLAACGGQGRRTYTIDALVARTVRLRLPALPRATTVKAERVVARDALVTRLLQLGGGQQSARATLWEGVDGRFLGAVVRYNLKRPITLNSDLPYAAIPPDGPAHGDCIKPYAAGEEHFRGTDVTVLQVLIDLRKRRVAEVDTDARGVRSPVAGKPYPSCIEDQG